MRKILLDFNPAKSVERLHQYSKFELKLDGYYGNNLDEPFGAYWKKLVRLFRDAEVENEHLAVIFGDMEQNYESD